VLVRCEARLDLVWGFSMSEKSSSISTATISGTVKTIDERHTSGGRKVVSANLWADKGYYMDCQCWNTAFDHVEEGDIIVIAGDLEQNSWDNKTTGKKEYRMRMNVQTCKVFGKSNSEAPY